MKKVYSWLTSNGPAAAILFFLAFIPLYPKLPIINVIRTWVYIRLEDFLVAAAIGIYVLLKLKSRRIPKTPLTWPISIYWGVGAVSAIYSVLFIGPTLVGYFPHLVAFHFLRRIEYMMLFFMAFDVVATRKRMIPSVVWTIAATTAGIIVYGFGQKIWGWPAFLTMNEEFAKGIPLRLPPTARIPSTFGGHYDLAAFMVLVIPILVTCIFAAQKLWQKILFLVLSFGSLSMLLLTESRTSFLVYIVGITATLMWLKRKIWIIPVIVLSFFMLTFVKGASDRFYKTFRYNDVIVDLSTGKPVGTLASLDGGTAIVQKSQSPAVENLPTGSQYIGLPATSSAQTKTVSYTTVNLASGSGEIATVSGSFLIQKALVYDISITTRLQGEWPAALVAFKRNILLGSGYSTLSLAADGDYIRMLGETGILGSVAFLGILLAAYTLFFRKKDSLVGYEKAFVIGLFGGVTGLLCNAILIDVFEASKVAFSLWLLLGIGVAILSTSEMTLKEYGVLLKHALTSHIAFFVYIIITSIVLFGSSVSNYFVADDFTWLKWAASSSYGDLAGYFTHAAGFFYRPIPKLVYFLLYAIFWLKPEGYHVVSLLLYALATYVLYRIMLQSNVKRGSALLLSILFASLSIHHESVFWISGLSSLLAALFVFSAVLTYRSKQYFLALPCMVLSMFSYDGMLVAPIILVLLSERKNWKSYLILLAIPVYWILRMASGAVSPSGDYGYRLSTLPFNVIGNTVGYVLSTFFGPRVVEYAGVARDYLRLHKLIAALCLLPVAVVVWKAKSFMTRYREVFLWVLCGVISLGAYLGLGNMSERYALVASGFFVVALGVWMSRQKMWLVLFVIGLIVWNSAEMIRIAGDWQKASGISQETLSIMNRQFFPLRENKDFIYIDTPIRYGRAWVFPTGLTDPLWHVFRLNSWSFTTTNVSSPEDAYAVPSHQGYAPEIFKFEEFHLKRLVKVAK